MIRPTLLNFARQLEVNLPLDSFSAGQKLTRTVYFRWWPWVKFRVDKSEKRLICKMECFPNPCNFFSCIHLVTGAHVWKVKGRSLKDLVVDWVNLLYLINVRYRSKQIRFLQVV